MTCQIIPFFPRAPHTTTERIEANRLEIVELETMLSMLNAQYEHAIDVYDMIGAAVLQQNGQHIKAALQDAYMDRDLLRDGGM